jgi:hypothetical protein
MGNFLGRTDLLKKEVLKIEKVEFEDGDYVFVRQMTGHERDAFEQSMLRKVKDAKGVITHEQATEDFRAKMAVNSVCDEAGVLVFVLNDYKALSNNMSARKLEIISKASTKLNEMTEEDKDELIKNLEADQPGNSSSNSVES